MKSTTVMRQIILWSSARMIVTGSIRCDTNFLSRSLYSKVWQKDAMSYQFAPGYFLLSSLTPYVITSQLYMYRHISSEKSLQSRYLWNNLDLFHSPRTVHSTISDLNGTVHSDPRCTVRRKSPQLTFAIVLNVLMQYFMTFKIDADVVPWYDTV